MDRIKDIVQHEQVRRSLLWSGLLIGSAILFQGITSTENWVYLMLLLVSAMSLETWIVAPGESGLQRWSGPVAAALLIAIAVIMRLLIAW